MVYGKRKTYKKGNKPTKHSSYSLAKTALRKVNQIQKQVEHKYLDTSVADATLAAAGSVTNLFAPAVGTGEGDKIGDKVFVKNLRLKMIIQDVTSNVLDGIVRVIIVRIPSKISSTPSVTSILTSAVPEAQFKRQGGIPYRVLMDKTYVLGKTNSTNLPTIRYCDQNLRIHQRYDDDGTNAIGELFLITLHNCTDEKVSLTGSVRINYTDF